MFQFEILQKNLAYLELLLDIIYRASLAAANESAILNLQNCFTAHHHSLDLYVSFSLENDPILRHVRPTQLVLHDI